MILEIRTYRVRAGKLDEFLAAMTATRPLLADFDIDVVTLGRSLALDDAADEADDGSRAYLLRAFDSLAERDRLEDAFYGSDAWRNGPRASVLEHLDSYHSVVLELPTAVIDGLRDNG